MLEGTFEHPLQLQLLIHGYGQQHVPLSELTRSQRITLGVLRSLAGLPRLPGTEEEEEVNADTEGQIGLELEMEGKGGSGSVLERKEIEERTKSLLAHGNITDEPEQVGSVTPPHHPASEASNGGASWRQASSSAASVLSTSSAATTATSSSVATTVTTSTAASGKSGRRAPPPPPGSKNGKKNPFVWQPKLSYRSIFLELWPLHAPPSASTATAANPDTELPLVDAIIGKEPLLRKTIPTGAEGLFKDRITLNLPTDGEPIIGVRIVGTLFEMTEEEDYVAMVCNSNATEGSEVKRRWEEALMVDDLNFPENRILGPRGNWMERRKRAGRSGYNDVRVRIPPVLATQKEKDVKKRVTVISDIDDTIKHSHVLAGVRTIMRNVFALPLDEVVVEGVEKWYKSLEKAGAEFAYVSNGPIEAWMFTQSFLERIGVPQGAVMMKSYGSGMAFLSRMMEESGARKRSTLEATIEEFKGSKFILVGDSGEADLELYVSIARKYAGRILAIFIRDVTTPHVLRDAQLLPPPAPPLITPIDEEPPTIPTAQKSATPPAKPAKPASLTSNASNPDNAGFTPPPVASPPGYATPLPPPASTKPPPPPVPPKRTNSMTITHPSGSSQEVRGLTAHVPLDFFAQNVELTEGQMSALEKFYARIWNAENQLPLGVKLKIFSRPEECIDLSLKVIEEAK
ncbi:hypothetical protein BT69DRAFT_880444 [Atractiella rhizophila]|nr:hypothetical protein BT69DRAFT_880444 [Atractiella rhizophila]